MRACADECSSAGISAGELCWEVDMIIFTHYDNIVLKIILTFRILGTFFFYMPTR